MAIDEKGLTEASPQDKQALADRFQANQDRVGRLNSVDVDTLFPLMSKEQREFLKDLQAQALGK